MFFHTNEHFELPNKSLYYYKSHLSSAFNYIIPLIHGGLIKGDVIVAIFQLLVQNKIFYYVFSFFAQFLILFQANQVDLKQIILKYDKELLI